MQLLLLLFLLLLPHLPPGDVYENENPWHTQRCTDFDYEFSVGNGFGFVPPAQCHCLFMVSLVCNSYVYYLHNIRI